MGRGDARGDARRLKPGQSEFGPYSEKLQSSPAHYVDTVNSSEIKIVGKKIQW